MSALKLAALVTLAAIGLTGLVIGLLVFALGRWGMWGGIGVGLVFIFALNLVAAKAYLR